MKIARFKWETQLIGPIHKCKIMWSCNGSKKWFKSLKLLGEHLDLNIPSRVKILERFDVADRLSFARDFTAKFLFVGRRGLMRLDEHKYLKNCAKLC